MTEVPLNVKAPLHSLELGLAPHKPPEKHAQGRHTGGQGNGSAVWTWCFNPEFWGHQEPPP